MTDEELLVELHTLQDSLKRSLQGVLALQERIQAPERRRIGGESR